MLQRPAPPVAVLVGAALALCVWACPGTGGGAPPSVILIVVDTLRADHMGLYGHHRPTTPRLDELAAAGTVFEWAFSAAAWTLPGVSSILTGRLPAEHGAGRHPTRRARFNRIRRDVPTLAELLSQAGYATGAIANGGYLSPGFRLTRGFDRYDFHPASAETIRRADASVDLALEWVDGWGEEPFFLFLHLFDPHHHYDAPEPARGTFTDRFADRYDDLDRLESRVRARQARDLEFDRAAYDEEVLWTDMQVGRLADGLAARGVWEESLVVLTADHGEAFGEHGAAGHGASLFNEVIRVPLLLWGPGVPSGRVAGPASTVDVVPTILDALGLDAPDGVTGIPLLPPPEEPPRRLIFAENDAEVADHVAVISWPLKLIHDFDHEISLLFDLERDPDELVDLTESPDRALRRAARELRRQAREVHRGRVGEEVELDPGLAEELRALGYIQ